MQAAQQPGPYTTRFVSWSIKHGRLIWTLALLLAIPAGYRTTKLYIALKSDLEALLPPDAASVKAIQELRARTPGLQYLGVVVDTATTEQLPAGEKLLSDLAQRIKGYPSTLVRAVRLGDQEERDFIEKNAPLLVEIEDLNLIRERVQSRHEYEVAKATGTLFDLNEQPPSFDFKDIQDKYLGAVSNQNTGGRFSNPALHTSVMLIETGGFSTGTANGKKLLNRVKADLETLGGPKAYGKNLRVGYTGDVAISVEETSALIADLSLSSLVVMVLVIASLLAFYRWWRSVIILVVPLMLGTAYTFFFASLPPFNVTSLNSNTAFLGSIVVGNGINFGIILLARYMEERRSGRDVVTSLVWGVSAARVGTLAAALAAGVAYASLIITEFRGFRQFGYIGGLGMVSTWITTFLLVPSLVHWLDSGTHAAPKSRPQNHGITFKIAGAIQRFASIFALCFVLLSAAAVWFAIDFSNQDIEHNFSKLRSRKTWVSGEGYWGRRMDKVLGRYLTPMVVLTDSEQSAEKAAHALRQAIVSPELTPLIASIRTMDNVFPSNQEVKLKIVHGIESEITPAMRSGMSSEQKERLDRFTQPESLKPFTESEVPRVLTLALREKDGTMGKTVLIFPKPSKALWDGQAMLRLVDTLRHAISGAGDAGKPAPRLAGSLPLSADIIRAIKHDGLLACAAALVGVILVLLLLFRFSKITAYVLGSLVFGMLWLVAALGLFDIRLNFANFIAFPITLGIGVDYAVNIMARYERDGQRDIRGALTSTGGAVALCSLTTVIGYASLLFAENQALFLFGVVAVLGEITCLVSALVLLPTELVLINGGSAKRPVQAVP